MREMQHPPVKPHFQPIAFNPIPDFVPAALGSLRMEEVMEAFVVEVEDSLAVAMVDRLVVDIHHRVE